jgi:hypothetical protein
MASPTTGFFQVQENLDILVSLNTQSYNILFHTKLAIFYKILTVIVVILITLAYLCVKLFEINGKTKQNKVVRSFLYRYPFILSF